MPVVWGDDGKGAQPAALISLEGEFLADQTEENRESERSVLGAYRPYIDATDPGGFTWPHGNDAFDGGWCTQASVPWRSEKPSALPLLDKLCPADDRGS